MGKVFLWMSRGEKIVDSGRDGLKLGEGWELYYRVGERLVGIGGARPQAES